MTIQYKEVIQAQQKSWPKSRDTINKLKLKNMSKDIKEYIRKCAKCQKSKTNKHAKTPLTITEAPQGTFDNVIVDTIGLLPRSETGNEYAVTLICDLSCHNTYTKQSLVVNALVSPR